MEERKDLFKGFKPVSKEAWIAQATKDLKGAAFQTLEHSTADGIKIAPFYTAEDIHSSGPLFKHTDWEVCERVDVQDAERGNFYALDYLNNGATAIIFRLFGDFNPEILLKDIGIEYIAVHFVVYRNADHFTTTLDHFLTERKLNKATLNLTVNFDPIAHWVTVGEWLTTERMDLAIHKRFVETNPNCRNLCINGEIYHEAGATPSYEIGCLLAHANEYLNELQEGVPAVSIQISVAVGADYFTEIAKLRALRKVFALLLGQYRHSNYIYLHATTAHRSLTIYDQYNNLLRGTTAAMAAVAGGCESLTIAPFNSTYKQSDDFSERLARNTQLILKHESYFDKFSDVAAGAYYLEILTEELAQKSWEHFKEIEAAGGFLASLKVGIIQQTIARMAGQEQTFFDEGKKVLVGINKFPNASQQMRDFLEVNILRELREGTAIQTLRAHRLAAIMEQERLKKETLNA
jgi:methylmalonyl-CoA mutase